MLKRHIDADVDATTYVPNKKTQEKRAARDGQLYTKEEFIEFYGGTAEWDAAVPLPVAEDSSLCLIDADALTTTMTRRRLLHQSFQVDRVN